MMFDSETSDFESAPRDKSVQYYNSNGRMRPLYRGIGADEKMTAKTQTLRGSGAGAGAGGPRAAGGVGTGVPSLSPDMRDRGPPPRDPYPYYANLRGFEDDSPLVGQKGSSPTFVPYLPPVLPEANKQSSIVTIFAVWNTIMGSSLLAMPWGLERAGLAGGVLLVAAMGALCLYTTWRILSVNRMFGDGEGGCGGGEVSDLCRKLLGRWAELLARVFSLVVLLGAIIVYWILMSNFLYHSIDYLHAEISGLNPVSAGNASPILTPVKCHLVTENGGASGEPLPMLLTLDEPVDPADTFHQWWNLHTTVPIILVVIMAPLINFKSATFFTKFNSVGTLSVMYLVVFVVVKATSWGVNVDLSDETSEHYTPAFMASFPATSGMLALSFFIHNIIVTIMRSNRHQANNGRDLSIAYILVTLTYAVIGIVFYVCFPLAKMCIEDNLLNNFESWDPMTVAARAFLFFQLVTVFPLVAYMLRAQLCTIFLGQTWPGRLPVLAINAVFITTCVLFALFLPRFGTIVRFTGALSGLVYVFLLPILLHLASLQRQGKLTTLNTVLHLTIPVIGGCNLLAQFFVSDS